MVPEERSSIRKRVRTREDLPLMGVRYGNAIEEMGKG
jgi:hypothetical protein